MKAMWLTAAAGLAATVLLLQQQDAAAIERKQPTVQTAPKAQQLEAPPQRRKPGLPGELAPGGTGIVARTHCNGSCMCTGADCTETWKNEYCKDAPACSSDPGQANLVCSCVKKAAN